ncbi:hypothetical protein [Pedobacter xixiisoli]|nr:hypothetical protein [Pedobacter xixiisoli]
MRFFFASLAAGPISFFHLKLISFSGIQEYFAVLLKEKNQKFKAA